LPPRGRRAGQDRGARRRRRDDERAGPQARARCGARDDAGAQEQVRRELRAVRTIRGKLLAGFTTLALVAIGGMALGGYGVLRPGARAQARASFAAARTGLEHSLAQRYRVLLQIANLSYLLPVIRAVAGTTDASDFGLGSRATDAENLERLHANLVDA